MAGQTTDIAALAKIDEARLTGLLERSVAEYSPSFAEEPAMTVFAEALAEADIAYLRQPVPDRAHGDQLGNLLVEIGPQPPALMWVGHVDTVPVIEEEQLAAERTGDLLYGLGTADMKGGCAAIIEAVTALIEAGATFKRGLTVALVVGEEEYGDGSEALAARVAAPLTVIGEPTSLTPCVDHYGYYEYRLETKGTQAHAALPEMGASAIHAMLAWLMAMYEEEQTPRYADSMAFNPREIYGGGDLFVVAPDCSAMIDIHAKPGIDDALVADLVERARTIAARTHPLRTFASEQVFSSAGYAQASGAVGIDPLRTAFEGEGLNWSPTAFRSHSDAPMFQRAGATAVVCGPGALEVAHTRNEHVSLAEVAQAARVYTRMIHAACCA
jgi:acetylornithine deacetylase